MVDLPKKKAGLVACSGEELAEGTVARLAALKVLHELRRGDTVTICLPLFLAGGEGDRSFARFNPTITIDGCERRCAAIGTEKYSARPAVSVVVNDLVASEGLPRPHGCRRLDSGGLQVVRRVAQVVAELVDEVLGRSSSRPGAPEETAPVRQEASVGTCSCGSGMPVLRLDVDGRVYELLAMPAIFDQMAAAGKAADDAAVSELIEQAKIYNSVPGEVEARVARRLLEEYRAHLERGARK